MNSGVKPEKSSGAPGKIDGECKRREGISVSFRVSVVIRSKFHLHITSNLPRSRDALVQ